MKYKVVVLILIVYLLLVLLRNRYSELFTSYSPPSLTQEEIDILDSYKSDYDINDSDDLRDSLNLDFIHLNSNSYSFLPISFP